MQHAHLRFVWGVAVVAFLVVGNTRFCQAGPTATVGAKIPVERRIPVDQIDHSVWDGLLSKYVDSAGMVDYRAWKASAEDREPLRACLQHLSAASFGEGASREARPAFWINAYNAVNIEGILPTHSRSTAGDPHAVTRAKPRASTTTRRLSPSVPAAVRTVPAAKVGQVSNLSDLQDQFDRRIGNLSQEQQYSAGQVENLSYVTHTGISQCPS